MGYTLRIGEATVYGNDDGTPLGVMVKAEHRDDAPRFDEYNEGNNTCFPSYTQWKRFAEEVGLEGLFYGVERHDFPDGYETDVVGLLRPHPGCRPVTRDHLALVREAVAVYKRKFPNAKPGWDPAYNSNGNLVEGRVPDITYSPDLARLMWLEWWMAWALENCETPAFFNG